MCAPRLPVRLRQRVSQGGRVVATTCADAVDDLTVATYLTTEQFIQENPDVVDDDFQAAIQESLQYANDVQSLLATD